MKSIPAALNNHYQLGVTTTTMLLRLTRTDGTILRFTTLDADVPIGAETYQSVYGFSPTGLHSAAGAAVDNMEMVVILNAAGVNESDILAGVYDNARIEMFCCNYKSTGDGVEILKTGYVGEMAFGDIAYKAELRGLSQALQQVIGSVSQASCRVDLYSSKCKVVKATFTFTATVTGVTDNANFADNATAAIIDKPDDYFSAGEGEWLTGNNAGRVMEIKQFTQAGGLFKFFLPMQKSIQIGDTIAVSAGCDKSLLGTHGCKLKFNNVVNHQGDPYKRNQDFTMDFPDAA